jgi:hypothetical protein
MSHHLDSPLARQDPRLDISDVYLFRGTRGTVFVLNANPLSGEGGFHPEGLYEFRIDTDGDDVENLTFRLAFGPRVGDVQSYTLTRLDGADVLDRHADGTVLAAGRTGEDLTGKGGVRVWAGAAADPFYIYGAVIGAVKQAVLTGTALDLSGAGEPENLFANTNVSAVVLEVPDEEFSGVAEIGFWATTALATDEGGWRQINRCAQPLVNTIFNPDDSERASYYNVVSPGEDLHVFGPLVLDLTAGAVAALHSHEDPAEHGRRVRDLLLPDILRYEIGTTANFGFTRRNGRGLTDCAPEVMFALVLNRAVPLSLGPAAATGRLRPAFPYLAEPHS